MAACSIRRASSWRLLLPQTMCLTKLVTDTMSVGHAYAALVSGNERLGRSGPLAALSYACAICSKCDLSRKCEMETRRNPGL